MYLIKHSFILSLALIISLLSSQKSYAQDLHFSQFANASVLLSPTETGNYHGDWRLVNNYRNQWGQIGRPLNTVAVAFDRQIYIFNQKLSIGGQIVHDESGEYLLVQQKFLLSAAYHQTLGYHTFRIGVQGGLVQKRINSGGFAYPDQWDQKQGYFNNALSTNETTFSRIAYYSDFNVGVAYSRRIWKLKPDVTFALFHINRPNETFLNQDNKLKIRKVVYIRMPYELNTKWTLDPQILYMWQNKTIDFILGSNMNYNLASNRLRAKYAFGGVSVRNAMTRNWDALIFMTGLQFKHVRAAVSYDVTISKLQLANSFVGAYEFALIYTGLSSVLNQRAIPCQRF